MPYTDSILRGTNPSFTLTGNEANPLIPIEFSRTIIQNATAKSVVMQLVKPMRMDAGQKVLPVLNSLPITYWTDDGLAIPGSLKQTTAVDWRPVVLVPAELAALVVVPDAVRKDASVDMWAQIKPLLEQAIGKAVDLAVLFGIGKPSVWTAPAIKTGAVAAGNVVVTPTGTLFADTNNLLGAVEADGFPVTGIAMPITMKAAFRGQVSTTGQPIFNAGEPGMENATFGANGRSMTGDILGVPAVIGMNGAWEDEKAAAQSVNMIAGDWTQLYLAIREDINFEFSNSAVIQDAAGAIVVNAWQQDATILRVTFRCAYAVPNPINPVNPVEATRFPFSVYKDAA